MTACFARSFKLSTVYIIGAHPYVGRKLYFQPHLSQLHIHAYAKSPKSNHPLSAYVLNGWTLTGLCCINFFSVLNYHAYLQQNRNCWSCESLWCGEALLYLAQQNLVYLTTEWLHWSNWMSALTTLKIFQLESDCYAGSGHSLQMTTFLVTFQLRFAI